ncbi:MAG TPA: amino acid racemase [Candidatus Angelobacter sp.]|nr:amino acid racemase [Candidatus Angelobacter sp.]
MKTLGIVGGIGPESTIEYYRAIIAAYREQHDGNYPSIIINSISVKQLLDLVGANRLEEVTGLLVTEIERLARAGADFALMASNTPHIVFDEVRRRSSIPLVSIVQAAAEASKAQGLKKVGLFGTRFTMRAPFYPQVFAQERLAVVLPHDDEQNFIHEKYMVELLNNIIRPDTRDRLLAIVRRMKEQDGIQGLILGGTELPLILRDSGDTGVTLLDTTQIHARAAALMME